jgi:hypothetical protein
MTSPEGINAMTLAFMEMMAEDAGDPIWPGEDPRLSSRPVQ